MKKIIIAGLISLIGLNLFAKDPTVTFYDIEGDSFHQILLESEEGNCFLSNTMFVKLTQTYEITIPSWPNTEARIYFYFDDLSPLHYGLESNNIGFYGLPSISSEFESRIVHSETLIIRAVSQDENLTATFNIASFQGIRKPLIKRLIADSKE